MHSIKQGTIAFPRVSLVNINRSLGIVQWIETTLSTLVNCPSLITIHAARIFMTAKLLTLSTRTRQMITCASVYWSFLTTITTPELYFLAFLYSRVLERSFALLFIKRIKSSLRLLNLLSYYFKSIQFSLGDT